MDAGMILKWGLLAVAAIVALRFIGGLMERAIEVDDGPRSGPQSQGVVWMYPAGVYPNRRIYGRNRPGRGR